MPGGAPLKEFHISREARDHYRFDESLFLSTGNVVIANFRAARLFAQKMNEKRNLVRFPEQAVRAGQINAMGLIDEILHFVLHAYEQQKNPRAVAQALDWLDEKLGREAVDRALHAFADQFPPVAVYRGQVSLDAYLRGETAGISHRQVVLEEMVMLWLANVNPALASFLELFDDSSLRREPGYRAMPQLLHEFFETQPRFGPDNQNLMDMLRSPALTVPHSLEGQLEYILKRWGYLLGEYIARILSSLDLIQEETRAFFLGPGPSEVPVYDYAGLESEPERFSPDLDWMPKLVLIAKNVFVWLDQLSKEYARPITHLDQVPDEELDKLARWGITGLWLIGVWERSGASRRIKEMMGNPEAAGSAYSVFDYEIAVDLGGNAACENLKERAWVRGIRLASDMVPNHMSIDSRWVIEHPDWFISLDHSPFPSYTFNGPDLSWDARVGIFLEDHYYTRTDAAVVFKRLDRWTGSERYIYHGNDGTSMPWNDTAQLNYLMAPVREAVMQAILHVARQFPIIRFDAAMTLTKRHYQRLWFPEPGRGGAIPTRAEQGMTRQALDRLMPEEFWREVVDRVAARAPDTLLLAEAFWLMEGYFVRSLGMHRVYNSAFMNMLRDEENAKYRSVIKNTIEFDPEILRRYVNFMSNPDERTAVDQFGKGDKYFGICTMMVTLPGLPMFGHGQIEGYAEKYGMEFRRSYWSEQPDAALVERHAREIFPLLRRRHLFADVDSFRLYDFFASDGHVNEDVFAYSNRAGEASALIIYHNKYATARGWIRTSAAHSVRTGQDDDRTLVQSSLAEGLGLHPAPDYFTVLRDQSRGLEYLRSSQELCEKGLYVELNAYQYHVFADIWEVRDSAQRLYARLAAELAGRGVPSVDEALRLMSLQPVHKPFQELVNPEKFRRLLAAGDAAQGGEVEPSVLDEVQSQAIRMLQAVKQFSSGTGDEEKIALQIRRALEFVLPLATLPERLPPSRLRRYHSAITYLQPGLSDLFTREVMIGWAFVHALGRIVEGVDPDQQSRSWIDEWLLDRILAETFRGLGLDDAGAAHAVAVVQVLTSHQHWFKPRHDGAVRAAPFLEGWLRDVEVQRFLQVNRYGGVVWFRKESFDQLLWWMFLAAVIEIGIPAPSADGEQARRIAAGYDVVERLRRAEELSEYQLESLVAIARQLDAPSYRAKGPKAGRPRTQVRG